MGTPLQMGHCELGISENNDNISTIFPKATTQGMLCSLSVFSVQSFEVSLVFYQSREISTNSQKSRLLTGGFPTISTRNTLFPGIRNPFRHFITAQPSLSSTKPTRTFLLMPLSSFTRSSRINSEMLHSFFNSTFTSWYFVWKKCFNVK